MRRALLLLSLLCQAQDLTTYKVETVTASHKFLEGPVWSAHDGVLLFSDIPSNLIHRIDAKGMTVFREDSGGANGNAFDDKGRLYSCEGHNRRVTRTDKKGEIQVLVDQFEGKKLNSPNDIAITKNDHIYFTDPAFGTAVDTRELPFYGVFHVSSKGTVTAVLKLQTRPNGVAISPDGNTLYLTNSDERNVHAYDIAKDGSLQNERVFVARTEGVPDGVKVDDKGNVYVAAADIYVFTPKGEKLGMIDVAEKPSNLAFGDGDLKSLYVTARSILYRIRIDAKGVALY
jgi:gluconolactonase